MASATLEFACIDGLTLTAELYTPGTDTLVQSSITCTERTNNKSVYTGSIVNVASGSYRLRVRNAGNNTILTDFLDHTNATGTEYPGSEVVLNGDTLIDGKTPVEALKYIGASAAGKVSGAGSGTEVFKGLDGTTTRLTATVDSVGNRTAITYG